MTPELADGYYEDTVCPDCGEPFELCECHDGEECGRWSNGRLMNYCAKAGSEECDFECPYRDAPRRRRHK